MIYLIFHVQLPVDFQLKILGFQKSDLGVNELLLREILVEKIFVLYYLKAFFRLSGFLQYL